MTTPRKHVIFLILLGSLLGVGGPGCIVRWSGYAVVDVAPPPARVVVVAPRAGYVWIDGRWVLNGAQWVWYDGTYEAERPGHLWVQGRWVVRGGRYHWVAGGWHKGRGRREAVGGGVIVREHGGPDHKPKKIKKVKVHEH